MQLLLLLIEALTQLLQNFRVVLLVLRPEVDSRPNLVRILPVNIQAIEVVLLNKRDHAVDKLARLCLVKTASEKLPDQSHPPTETSTVSDGFCCLSALSAAKLAASVGTRQQSRHS